MAYAGYLIKVGDYTIPHKYIRAESYSPYRNIQDLDSFRDADGLLHRTALEHIPNKVEFDTVPMMTNTEFAELMGNIQANFTNALERKASVRLYIPETDSYVTQDMYMPDVKPTLYFADEKKILYNAVRLAFIGY